MPVMNPQPLSFIIPVFDVEAYLDECVHSIVRASLPGDEIILVEDGSRDSSGAICETWSRQHPQLVQVLRQTNQGLSAARNNGLRASRQPYVLFMDSDDVVIAETVAAARDMLARQAPDILVCDFIWWYASHSRPDVRSRPTSHPPGVVSTDSTRFNIETLDDFLLSACTRFFSRSLLESLGPEPFPVGIAYEEVATIPRLTLRARRITYLPEALFKYRMREGSITHTPTVKHCRDRCTAMLPFMSELRETQQPRQLQLVANMRLAHQMTMAIRDCGLMDPQVPSLYRELVTSAFSGFSIPVDEIIDSLRHSHRPELRKIAMHIWLARLSPLLYESTRRLIYNRRRKRLAHRAMAGHA